MFFWLCFFSVALSLDHQTGNFEVGKDFDALRVNVAAPDGPIDMIQKEEPKVGSGALVLSVGLQKQTQHKHKLIKANNLM